MGLLDEVTGARIPGSALPLLAEIRCAPGVEVISDEAYCWLRWPREREAVVQRLLPIAGVQLFVKRDNRWHELGRSLPAGPIPLDRPGMPLLQVLVPAAVHPEMPTHLGAIKLALRLAADSTPRQTTALRCPLVTFRKWIDGATSAQIDELRAAVAEDQVLVLGTKLPVLPGNRRYWGGSRILAPLGLRPDPPFTSHVLLEGLQIQEDEVALLEENGVEVLSQAIFADVTRAGVRMALRNRP
jgi:hypothetical protein